MRDYGDESSDAPPFSPASSMSISSSDSSPQPSPCSSSGDMSAPTSPAFHGDFCDGASDHTFSRTQRWTPSPGPNDCLDNRDEPLNSNPTWTSSQNSTETSFRERIFLALRGGDCRKLQEILQTCHGNVNFFDPEGQTALTQSCLDGNFEAVKLLVGYGADVRLANRDGWSPLHIAAYMGSSDVVMYLLSRQNANEVRR
ncbi:unnamed protein product [Darwinula stevensoni]|uniref:Notch-regulated ankyrin repeat-containing protein n=1 Tax=Darwinula stevensoni TaxID=69355 RepID=A0A7R8XFK7_9CRUS|nr:unnamed protein product [Darwinula stevensoni]CAG0891703.1 unnamed protein product [Darwinula stevensoni]